MNSATHMLSAHFSVDEALVSETASRYRISNVPSEAVLATMEAAAGKLERVRILLDNLPLHINSWFRCLELNRALHSKDNSQHLVGEAIDFICPQYGSPTAVAKKILAYKELIGYDQLILEHTWVHISFSILNSKPKGQVLSLLSNGGYATGLTDALGNPIT
jgi:zinc D-Ala-D-Ala carboxypeptidase